MIVSRALATHFWPNSSVLGRRVRIGGPDGPEVLVVGVSGDAVYRTPAQLPLPTAFLPAPQHANAQLTLIAHSSAPPAATIAGIENTIRSLDPAVAAYGATTLDRASRQAVRAQQTAAVTAAVFGVLALLLAVVGLYGVIAYNVERRKREMGIRMTLGASSSAVLRLILRHAGRTALLGLGLGLGAALLAGRFMTSLLYAVQPHDPIVLGVVTLALALVVLLASWIPARRAARTDPLMALRAE
jgi:predicted lysophospholipase L1 biosynthesis ABC-type transport system permease subunit